MITYTGGLSIYSDLTNDSTATNQTNGALYINEANRKVLGKRDWPFLEKTGTTTTTASTQFYTLPYDYGELIDVTLTQGTTIWTPRQAPDADFWDRLNYNSAVTSNIPEWFYIFAGRIGLWPTPSTSSLTLTFRYKKLMKDLNTADITSTTITTLANGGTALTVSGGLTAQMPGFWIRPTFSTTANTGDGFWYEISTVTNATTATLVKAYGGNSIAAGTAACTIGQVSLLPEQYQMLPIYEAVEQYYRKEGEFEAATYFGKKYEDLIGQMEDEYGSKTTSVVVRYAANSGQIPPQPNLYLNQT